MSKNENEEKRLRQEKIELLKLKQGIISESELIPSAPEKSPEPTFLQKAEAFFDLNKGFIAIGAIALAVVIAIFVILFSREAEDIMVLIIITDENSALRGKTDEIEKALEMYCPDFDGNGKIHVGLSVSDISSKSTGDAYRAQNDNLQLELDTGYRQLIISDGGFTDYMHKGYGENSIMGGELSGISLNSVGFAEKAGLSDCTNDIMFFIRAELKTDGNTAAVQRERALGLMENIVKNNMINVEGQN